MSKRALARTGSFVQWLLEPEPPGLGLDLRSGEIALARLADKKAEPTLDVCTTAPLPPEIVDFSMLTPNVLDEEALVGTLRNLLLRAGLGGADRVALTLPDHLARIATVELAQPAGAREDVAEILKFRLKKSLPFDSGKARLAYERLPGKKPAYLTGVMHEDVVAQYENVLARLGLHVGLIIPVSLGLLRLLKPVARRELAPGADYFLVDVERDYFSVSLVRDREIPVLIRTLGRRAGGDELYGEDDLLQEIIPTAIYYREKLSGTTLERVYYRSLRPEFLHLREILEEQFEAPTEPFNLPKAIAVAKELTLDAALADSVGAAAAAAVGRAGKVA